MPDSRLALHALGGAVFLALASCAQPGYYWQPLESDRILLASEEVDEQETTYSLVAGPGRVELEIARSRPRGEPYLGLELGDPGAEHAERLGPRGGVEVLGVHVDSPASRAGLTVGDMIRTLEDRGVSSVRRLRQVLEDVAAPGTPLTLEILPSLATEERQIPIVPEFRTKQARTVNALSLTAEESFEPWTGLRVAQIDPPHSLTVFDQESPALIVANVVLGSPAHRAGLRGGDRLLRVEGQNLTSVEEFSTYFDGIQEERTVRLEAIGPDGLAHTADLALERFAYESQVILPPILAVDSTPEATSWNVLFFLLDHHSELLPTATREEQRHRDTGFLFRCFALETWPDDWELTLFWFLKI